MTTQSQPKFPRAGWLGAHIRPKVKALFSKIIPSQRRPRKIEHVGKPLKEKYGKGKA